MPVFTDIYTRYMDSAARARSENKVEQERKRLFLDFLKEGFGIPFENMEIEKRVRLPQAKRGYVDALFGDLVFEFKQDLERGKTETIDQLTSYLTSQEMGGQNYLGIISDGLSFEVYRRDVSALTRLDHFTLLPDKPDEAFARLDAYLFSQQAQRPTAADIVFRFGATSPSFKTAFGRLNTLLKKTHYSALAVWREQWDKLLSKVYGDRVAGAEGDELYLKHTYLCQFAKLLAYGALNGRAPHDSAEVERIINGEAFKKDRVSNIGESDFFSWVLLDDIKAEALDLFRRLAAGLIVYDLSQIDQDLLKQLYQNLVDPSTRHDLGEYYTPDWLAELVLEDIAYAAPQSLLDPACGSGSFLFAAIKRLEQNGLHAAQLVDFAAHHIMGLDVHPLAVTIARLNYVLALSAALRQAGSSIATFPVPIYMADALQETGRDLLDKHSLVIPVRETEKFSVPLNIARRPQHYGEIIEQMEQLAKRAARDKSKLDSYSASFVRYVMQRSDPLAAGLFEDMRETVWSDNMRLLARLIEEGRNGIWAYILKNQARPMMLAERKFDVIVGNPPWLSYRYIKNREYQAQVKRLSVDYGLIKSGDRKLFTQIELCTLFAVHAERQYLCEGGTLALVMPRSVITGAKQHRAFQSMGLSRVIDLLGVGPLFNVPSCVTIIQGKAPRPVPVPSRAYSGRLPAHEMSLSAARDYLTERPAHVTFVDNEVKSPYYHPLFLNGASLYPRNLCFVAPEGDPFSPMFKTDPDADKEAKKPYKGLKLLGQLDNDYLYATLLSKHLVPFGHEKLHLVALPVRLTPSGALKLMTTEQDFMDAGLHFHSWEWFERAAHQWDSLSSAKMTFYENLNYQNKITNQRPLDGYRVLYNSSGVHLAACVLPPVLDTVHSRRPQALIVDFKTYYYTAQSADEAHYLCALLNATPVDVAIKPYQSRGKGAVGERDISRTPFEACAIPPYDAANATHQQLAALSVAAHEAVSALKAAGGITGGVVSIRRQARAAAAAPLAAIDELARALLGL